MAKNGVEGVYNKDPRKFDDAVKFEKISQKEVLKQNLQVMDQTAASICTENKINMIVFNMNKSGNIKRAVLEEPIGTVVTWEE